MRIKKLHDYECSPLSPRICACGCEQEFQPGRSDQRYLNRTHSQYGYNHGTRKTRYVEVRRIEIILKKNDRILDQYIKRSNHTSINLTYNLIKKEGFESNYFTSQMRIEGKIYFAIYSCCFRIEQKNDKTIIHIQKL